MLITAGGSADEVAAGVFENEYVVTTWDIDSGAPFIAVSSIAQSPDGYLWLGSYTGLARFDGSRYLASPSDEIPIDQTMVLTLWVDQKGKLWVGTAEGIRTYYQGEWSTLGTKEGLAEGVVYAISSDSKGRIAVVVGASVMVWNGQRFEDLKLDRNRVKGVFTETTCFYDTNDRLWLQTPSVLDYYENGQWHEGVRNQQSDYFMSAAPASNGGIWWADRNTINLWKDGQTIKTIARIAGHRTDDVRLWEDAEGNLWEVGERHGLVIHKMDGSHLVYTTAQGLANDTLIAIGHDNEGNVWLGSDGGGLIRVRPRSARSYGKSAGLTQPLVNAMIETDPGHLLVATHGGGILPFDGEKFGAPWQFGAINARSWVQAIAQSSDGALWLGAYNAGLVYRKGETSLQWGPKDLLGRHVHSLYYDRQERMWVGSEEGIVCFRGTELVSKFATLAKNGVVNMLGQDGHGRIWAATTKGQLWGQTADGFERVDQLGGLTIGEVEYLYEDEDGSLWITESSGAIFRETALGWQRYDQSRGLPLGIWKPVARDRHGDLWLGSGRGVMRIRSASLEAVLIDDTEQLSCQMFNRNDGMATSSCRAGFQKIGCRTADGRIWFATTKGLVSIDPDKIKITPQPAQVHIEQVRNGIVILGATLQKGESVEIPAGTERVNIRYSATSLSYGPQIMFTYLLTGVDNQWVDAGVEPVARLPDLRPGQYRFRLKAVNLEGVAGEETSVVLAVQPFWWEILWVRLLGAALLIVFVAIAVGVLTRSHYRRKNERLEQARELQEERALTAQVKQDMEAANAANRAKSDFLATMSHEIRTPLNGVIGSADMLLETTLNKEQHEHMATLRASAEALLSVLNDILDFSKIEAGRVEIEQTPFNLIDPLRDVIEVLTPSAIAKEIELTLLIEKEVPRLVTGDPSRLRQVLINLVGNAVKFTGKGHVVLSVELLPTRPHNTESEACLRFSVRDTGVGITPEAQTRLFERFTQADSSTTRKYGGTGLGLAICKRLVELMGGKISARSVKDRGSVFHFDLILPYERVALVKPSEEIEEIIIVDDYPSSLMAAVNLFENTQNLVRPASDLETIRAWLDAPPADSVKRRRLILDESVEITEEHQSMLNAAVRDHGWQLWLVVLNPLKIKQPPGLLLEGRIRKPLLDTANIFRATGSRNEPAAPIDSASSETTVKIKVLLADDDAVNRLVLEKQLRRLGCQVDLAVDGAEAVAMAGLHDYALIFMDCRMPVMDGFTATKEILRRATNPPPIIAITANTSPEDKEKCYAIGMVDFIGKPVRKTDLQRVLTHWVKPHSPDSTQA